MQKYDLLLVNVPNRNFEIKHLYLTKTVGKYEQSKVKVSISFSTLKTKFKSLQFFSSKSAMWFELTRVL